MMNLKSLFAFSIFWGCVTFQGIAQQNFRIGVICGSSISRYNRPSIYDQSFGKSKVGIYTKVICRLPMKNEFWLQTEVGLTDNGGRTTYNTDSIFQKIRESRYFIQFTELAGYSFYVSHEKRLRLNFETGLFAGYYLFSYENWKTENLLDHSIWRDRSITNKSKDDPMFRKYIAGISVGTGISKELRVGTVLVDFRYDLSLTRITKYPDIPELPKITRVYYQLFSLSIGYLFGENKW